MQMVYPVKMRTGRVRTLPRAKIDREVQEGKLERARGNFEYYVEADKPEREDPQTYNTRDMVAEPGERRHRRNRKHED